MFAKKTNKTKQRLPSDIIDNRGAKIAPSGTTPSLQSEVVVRTPTPAQPVQSTKQSSLAPGANVHKAPKIVKLPLSASSSSQGAPQSQGAPVISNNNNSNALVRNPQPVAAAVTDKTRAPSIPGKIVQNEAPQKEVILPPPASSFSQGAPSSQVRASNNNNSNAFFPPVQPLQSLQPVAPVVAEEKREKREITIAGKTVSIDLDKLKNQEFSEVNNPNWKERIEAIEDICDDLEIAAILLAEYRCPLSASTMSDPCVIDDEYTYDRTSVYIGQSFPNKDRLNITVTFIAPNKTLRLEIQSRVIDIENALINLKNSLENNNSNIIETPSLRSN